MKRKYKILAAALILAAAAAVWLFPRVQPKKVETEQMTYGDLNSSFTAQGTLLPVESLIINAVTSGTAGSLPYKPGESVAAGETLAQMKDSSQAELEIQEETYVRQLDEAEKEYSFLFGENGSAWLELDAAKKEFALAEQEYQNNRTLAETAGAVSQMDLAQLKLARDLASKRLAQAEEDCSERNQDYYLRRIDSCKKQMEAFRGSLSPADILMPYDGILWELYLQEGSSVAPGQAAARIYRPDKMKIEVSLLTEDAAKLSVGDEASVRFAGGALLTARITYLSRVAESGYSVIGIEENRCRAELEPVGELPENAGAGYEAEVTFTVNHASQVLTVPENALVPLEKGVAVYRILNGRARLTQVGTGISAGGRTIVTEGLSEGERVAVDPYGEAVKDGQRVHGKVVSGG